MSEVEKGVKPTFIDYARAHEIMARGDLLDAVAEAVALERIAREALAEARQDSVDRLTGLPSPAMAVRQANAILQQIEAGSRRPHQRIAEPVSAIAFMTDVVDFKQINDKKNRLWGDKAITAKAEWLSTKVIRETDVLARWGGDEFVMLVPVFAGWSEAEVIEIIAGRLAAVPQLAEFPSQIRWDFTTYQAGDDFLNMLSRIDINTDTGKNAAKYSDKNLLFSLD